MDEAKRKGGLAGRLKKLSAGSRAALAFFSLYTIPSKKNEVPENVRLEPAY
jgi:magnesium-protoporphyrin IX monomethyl ester (oxidative) cyclase